MFTLLLLLACLGRWSVLARDLQHHEHRYNSQPASYTYHCVITLVGLQCNLLIGLEIHFLQERLVAPTMNHKQATCSFLTSDANTTSAATVESMQFAWNQFIQHAKYKNERP